MQIQYENAQGKATDINSGNIRIFSVTGLSPISVINTSSISGYDGAAYISSQMPMRSITILLEVLGDVETNKQKLYSIFQVKRLGTLYCRTNPRNVKIQCYTEKIDFTLTSTSMEFQVSLLCPQPYFESLDAMRKDIAAEIALWEFPWEILKEGCEFSDKSNTLFVNVPNYSEIDVGMTIVFHARSKLTNPSVRIIETGEYMKLNATMLTGDTISINSRRGHKSITLLRDEISSNIFNTRTSGSTFLQLHQGNNTIRYDADSNLTGLEVTFYYTELFAGV